MMIYSVHVYKAEPMVFNYKEKDGYIYVPVLKKVEHFEDYRIAVETAVEYIEEFGASAPLFAIHIFKFESGQRKETAERFRFFEGKKYKEVIQ